METRVGLAAGAGLAAAAIFLAVFEVQGWKMPGFLAIAIIAVGAITGLVALVVLLHAVWVASAPLRLGWSIRSPFFKPSSATLPNTGVGAEPIPNWLRDILTKVRSSIGLYVSVRTDNWDGFKGIGSSEPFIDVIVEVKNWAPYPILVSGIRGSLTIEGNVCNMPAQLNMRSRFPHLHVASLRIHQPITAQTSALIAHTGNTEKEITIGLSSCTLEITTEEPGYEQGQAYRGLGGNEVIVPKLG